MDGRKKVDKNERNKEGRKEKRKRERERERECKETHFKPSVSVLAVWLG